MTGATAEMISTTHSAAENCYATAPLEASTRTIRLIRLSHAAGSDVIECELRSFLLDSAPVYKALSYTWGKSFNEKMILVNRSPFSVRPNLWAFLDQLRISKVDTWWWIDAVCIDQSSIREKNHQVNLMREIYSMASVVNIWLGPTKKAGLNWEASTSNEEVLASMMKLDRTLPLGRTAKHEEILKFYQDLAIKHVICSDIYWARAWIVQEVMLARHVVVQCGGTVLEWSCLEAMVPWLDFLLGPLNRLSHCQDSAEKLLRSGAVRIVTGKTNWHTLRFENKSTALRYLLSKYQGTESTDVRDRIYSFIGLLDHLAIEKDDLPLAADYSVSTLELFETVCDRLPCFSLDTFEKVDFLAMLANTLGLSVSEDVVRSTLHSKKWLNTGKLVEPQRYEEWLRKTQQELQQRNG